MQFAVVIPAYNEGHTIHDVAARALKQCSRVIVIDDGSSDDTSQSLHGLSIILIQHERNTGKADSLWDGMQAAIKMGVDAVVTLDGDGQHRPEDIPRLLSVWEQNRETIIIGSRMAEKSAFPAHRYYANCTANFWVSWAAGYPIQDSQSGLRMYPTSFLRKLDIAHDSSRGFVFESEVLIAAARQGIQSKAVSIPALYHKQMRSSHFRPVADIVAITRMVAWSLISRGLYPQGLLRVVAHMLFGKFRLATMGADGLVTLILSNFVLAMSGGISFLFTLYRVVRVAKTAAIRVNHPDWLIVLGMHLQNGRVRKEYKQRLDRSISIFEACGSCKIMLVGGMTGNSDISEAAAGRDYLLAQGIQEDDIVLEERSHHTLENLSNIRNVLLKENSPRLALITNRYHLARSVVLALGLGLSVTPCAAEARLIQDRSDWLPIAGKLLREAYYVHWYYTGKYWSKWTGNKKSLARIG
ncbi:MAG: hypothetical protein BMS9Abin36_0100 [Gammaproteobacteria bacterium]|nr:MAG: hypothetical protein BMS9Abin36_0100 [Gammaproteobacteria bacterium]